MKLQPPMPPATPDLTELMRSSPRRAPATLALVIANVGVFVVMLAFGAGLWHAPTEVQLRWGANFGPATQDGGWWRLGSAMFLHFGVLHLAMNMWALWDAGRLVERLYGPWRYAIAYLGAGVAGNLLSLVMHGNEAVSGGASGAVFGVYGALLVCLAHERRRLDPLEFRWIFGGAALFAAATLVLGQFVRGIDNAAHLGGLLGGALLGAMLMRPLSRESPVQPFGRLVAAAGLSLGVALLVANLPQPRYRLSDELAARAAIQSFVDEERRIGERWQSIVKSAAGQGPSFKELASRIDEDIARGYRESFADLSAIGVGADAPSAAMLEALRSYSQRRSEASHALADAVRSGDLERMQQAMDALRETAPSVPGSHPSVPQDRQAPPTIKMP